MSRCNSNSLLTFHWPENLSFPKSIIVRVKGAG
jgi:hypothetical protein